MQVCFYRHSTKNIVIFLYDVLRDVGNLQCISTDEFIN